MALSLKIASLNCRGLTRAAKQAEAIKLARQMGIDILALQETYIHHIDQMRQFDVNFGTKSYWNFGRKGSAGVAIVFLRDLNVKVLRYEWDNAGRTLSIDLDNGIRIINVYAPCKRGQR